MSVGLIVLSMVLSMHRELGTAGLHLTFCSLVLLRLSEAHLCIVYHRGNDVVYLLLYVDDIVLTASTPDLLKHTIAALQQVFQ